VLFEIAHRGNDTEKILNEGGAYFMVICKIQTDPLKSRRNWVKIPDNMAENRNECKANTNRGFFPTQSCSNKGY